MEGEAAKGVRGSRSRRRERRMHKQQAVRCGQQSGDDGDESPGRSKPPRPPTRKKRNKEPVFEEDVIDGFAILSFRTYEELEVSRPNLALLRPSVRGCQRPDGPATALGLCGGPFGARGRCFVPGTPPSTAARRLGNRWAAGGRRALFALADAAAAAAPGPRESLLSVHLGLTDYCSSIPTHRGPGTSATGTTSGPGVAREAPGTLCPPATLKFPLTERGGPWRGMAQSPVLAPLKSRRRPTP
ncbi:hypothetical protein HPB47_012438 [Ixodes persulcatus]|uniref:Uncharacterized protein n=1 Tax=Ixodes persulcatus TaxID=34615 RepID=A0AC60NTG4_IXOPE|nr:hypothetical protein HPB47_012438 [Ixodes persulcatus]